MSPTIHHKYKYFDSTVQRAKDRRHQFHFCRLPFDVTSSLISLMMLKSCPAGMCNAKLGNHLKGWFSLATES